MSELFDPPPHMELESKGKAVDLVLAFLQRWACQTTNEPHGIILDAVYGAVAVAWTKKYQEAHGVEADGGFGPQTREQTKLDGFDFVAEARALGEEGGITAFVQPDQRPTLYWGTDIISMRSLDEAQYLLYVAHHTSPHIPTAQEKELQRAQRLRGEN